MLCTFALPDLDICFLESAYNHATVKTITKNKRRRWHWPQGLSLPSDLRGPFAHRTTSNLGSLLQRSCSKLAMCAGRSCSPILIESMVNCFQQCSISRSRSSPSLPCGLLSWARKTGAGRLWAAKVNVQHGVCVAQALLRSVGTLEASAGHLQDCIYSWRRRREYISEECRTRWSTTYEMIHIHSWKSFLWGYTLGYSKLE